LESGGASRSKSGDFAQRGTEKVIVGSFSRQTFWYKVPGLMRAQFKLLPQKGEGGRPPAKRGWTEGVMLQNFRKGRIGSRFQV